MRFFQLLLITSAFGLTLIAPGVAADTKADTKPVSSGDTKSKNRWETLRNNSPESVLELKSLQDRVKEVFQKRAQTTVGLLIGNGAGSGVIVSEDGLVLTAAHVVGKPRQPITFVLSDGTKATGESLGVNASSDSGMAKITSKPPKTATWPGAKDGKWPVAEMGKSTELVTGQWVVSLGHPGGPKKDRAPPLRLGRFRGTDKYITTDCTLVGGDSGGPLFDLDGKVIGIHSQIAFSLESNMHVPIDKFNKEWERLVRGDAIGKRVDVELGVKFDATHKQAGAKVESIRPKGPAEDVLMPGDIILKLNGHKIASSGDLSDILTSYSDGDKVKLVVERDDESITVELKLAKRNPFR